MEDARYLLQLLLSPLFYSVLGGERIHVLFLSSALMLALAVYLGAHRRRAEGAVRGFPRYSFPKAIFRHPSAMLDYHFYVFGETASNLLLAPLLFGGVVIADGTGAALRWALGASAASARRSPSGSATASTANTTPSGGSSPCRSGRRRGSLGGPATGDHDHGSPTFSDHSPVASAIAPVRCFSRPELDANARNSSFLTVVS